MLIMPRKRFLCASSVVRGFGVLFVVVPVIKGLDVRPCLKIFIYIYYLFVCSSSFGVSSIVSLYESLRVMHG